MSTTGFDLVAFARALDVSNAQEMCQRLTDLMILADDLLQGTDQLIRKVDVLPTDEPAGVLRVAHGQLSDAFRVLNLFLCDATGAR